MSIIIIPAYNPDSKLIELIKKIKQHDINKIIVVNDGSNISSKPIFDKICSDVILLTHKLYLLHILLVHLLLFLNVLLQKIFFPNLYLYIFSLGK